MELYSYQLDAVKFFASATREGRTGRIFDMDPGLGKTLTAQTCFKILRKKGANCLYVTRKSLHKQALDEAYNFLGIRGTSFKGNADEVFEQIAGVTPKSGQLIVLSIGALRSSKRLEQADGLFKQISQVIDLLVVDECHEYKNPTSIQSKTMAKLARSIPLRIVMTGTLIGNSERDVFVPCLLADPTVFGESYHRFEAMYFNKSTYGMSKKYTLKEFMREDFMTRLNSIKFSKRLVDAVELPPLIKNVHKIEPSPQEVKIVKALEKDLVVMFDSGEKITGVNLMEQTMRLRQLASAVYSTKDDNDETTETFDPHHSKSVYLMERLEELFPTDKRKIVGGPKILIWTSFRTACEGIKTMLENRYSNPVATILGGQSEIARNKQIAMFQDDPNCHILVATGSAGGVGLNLQVANYMIFFSKNYSQIEDTQTEARAYRIGSQRHASVFRWDFIMANTIEEQIEKSLRNKKTIIQAVADWRATL